MKILDFKTVHEDFHLDEKEVLKELGVSSETDLADLPRDLYLQIAVVRR